MNKKETLKQICKMISSGDIPKEIYNKYLSNTPVGFMNYKESCNFFEIGDSNTNFMNFENLNKLVEEHKKETIPYKNYEFDSTSYTLLLIDINNLLKENQELNKQLQIKHDGFMASTDELCEYAVENQELKKQLEDRTKMYQNAYNYSQKMESKVVILETQQKEFIKYLEDGIKSSSTLDTINKQTAMYIYSTALKRYKEIIGDDKQ